MANKISARESGNEGQIVTLSLAGQLDIQSYEEFNASYKDHLGKTSKFIINAAELEHIDSSGLGMLLMLRERAGGAAANIEIVNCSPTVAKLLTAVKFDRLFQIN